MRALSILLAALWIGAAGPCPMGPGVPCPSGRQVTLGLTGGLPAGSTFTRAGNTATTLVNGVVTSVLANVARFPTDVNGKPQGYQNELGVMNLVTYSVLDGGTVWTYTNAPVTANYATAPDTTTSAALVADNATSGPHGAALTAALSFTSGTVYTQSWFVKAGTATVAQLRFGSGAFGTTASANFNLTTGTVGTVGASATAATPVAIGGGWWRIAITATATTTASSNAALYLTNNNTSASGAPTYVGTGQALEVWGCQVEALAFATSYIPTSGASATRNPDNLTLNPAALYPWWQTPQGMSGAVTWTQEGALGLTGGVKVFDLSDGTANNRMRVELETDGTVAVVLVTGGVSVTSPNQALNAVGTKNTLAWSATPAGVVFSLNGATPVTVANAGALATMTAAGIGRSSTGASLYNAAHYASVVFRRGPTSAAQLRGGWY